MKITDATGNVFRTGKSPERIVSLFPSQTHLLAALGLEKEVAGITRFCKYPAGWKKEKRIIGGTKDVHIERVKALNPDLILANKEENTKEIVEQLQQIAPVYVSEVYTWEDNLKFVRDIGALTGKTDEAGEIIRQMNKRKRDFEQKKQGSRKSALYFIWRNPWMTAGKPTFIDSMMHLAGFENLTSANKGRYPAWETEELCRISPEVVLLADEPYPFKPEKHLEEVKAIFPDSKILFVCGEPFTWFGAYPVEGLAYLEKIIGELGD